MINVNKITNLRLFRSRILTNNNSEYEPPNVILLNINIEYAAEKL